MQKRQLALLAGDAVLIIVSFYIAPVLQFGVLRDVSSIFTPADISAILAYLLIFYIFDLYNLDDPLDVDYFLRFVGALASINVLIGAVFYLLRLPLYSASIFLINGLLILSFCLGWRLAFSQLLKCQCRPSRVVIVGAGRAGRALSEILFGKRDYAIVGFLDDDHEKWGATIGSDAVIGGTDQILSIVENKRIDTIITAITHVIRPTVYASLVEAKIRGVTIYDVPFFYENVLGKIPVHHVNDLWFVNHMPVSGVQRNIFNSKFKRIFDLCLSVILLLLALPIAVIAAMAIKLDSRGPLFYVQRRIGLNEKAFNMVKFRSMGDRADGERSYAGQRDDTRITRVGRIIRLFRIDEIPQLWNVLKGDMSIIGPRALMEEEVRAFTIRIPYFNLRHSVRPGVTGWAQINYPHGATEVDAMEKLQYDLFYIKNLSLLLDLHIFLRTFYVVLTGKGAR